MTDDNLGDWMMSRQSIFAEVAAERERQDSIFGGIEHDSTHTATDWVSILVRHLGLAVDDGSPAGVCLMNDHCAGADPVRYRRQMVRVAAVAVAAVEVFDRKAAPAEPDRHRILAQNVANLHGEPALLVESDDPARDAPSRAPFVVLESAASAYEKTHHTFRAIPGVRP